MITNSNITVYNAYHDTLTRTLKYKKKVIYNVFWDAIKGVTRANTTLENADAVLVVVPLSSVTADYVMPKDFDGTPGTFTFKVGDRIIQGEIETAVPDNIAELDKNYEAFTITSVDLKSFGSLPLQHFEIRGK